MKKNEFKARKSRRRSKASDSTFINVRDLPSDNIYATFIENCRRKRAFEKEQLIKKETESSSLNERGEIHHIIPLRNHNGPDTAENCILLTREEHIIAHRLIAEATNNIADLNAYRFMLNIGSDLKSLLDLRTKGALASHELQRREKSNFFSIEYQKEMSRRSVLSEKGQIARRKRGPEFGKQRQENRLFTKYDKFLFSYKGKEFVCVTGYSTGGDITRLLVRLDLSLAQKKAENKMLRFTRIIKDESKSLYGWKIKTISDSDTNKKEKICISNTFLFDKNVLSLLQETIYKTFLLS